MTIFARDVFEQFRERGEVLGGELYLRPADARDLIAASEAAGLAVVGVEGVTWEPDGVRPRTDLIADFSMHDAPTWSEYRLACNAETRAFVAALPLEADLRVTMAILSEEDWRQGADVTPATHHAYYVFIWDKELDEMVASFCILRGSARPAGDVSHGVFLDTEEDAWMAELREHFPIDRYTYGGGYAPSLDACVRAFFGMEKDDDHF
jgi:hypothetical protein